MGGDQDAISLPLFAEITARVDSGESRPRVLAEKGISDEHFRFEQRRWLEEMAANAQVQRWELQHRFSAMYAKWRLGEPEPKAATLTGLRGGGRAQRHEATGVSRDQQVEAAPFRPTAEPAFERSGQNLQASDRWAAERQVPGAPAMERQPQQPGVEAQPSPETTGPVLSFEQLTCLAAELDVNPEQAEATLAGYGLDRFNYAAQRAALQRKCDADAELDARFNHLFGYYRAVVANR